MVAEGRRVTHVAVKVRTATFFTRTKISKLDEPTTDAAGSPTGRSSCSTGSRSTARYVSSVCGSSWRCRRSLLAMSGPVRTEDTAPLGEQAPARPGLEITPSRSAQVGAHTVRRALPRRARRTVGAWCFVDHMGPADGDRRPDRWASARIPTSGCRP